PSGKTQKKGSELMEENKQLSLQLEEIRKRLLPADSYQSERAEDAQLQSLQKIENLTIGLGFTSEENRLLLAELHRTKEEAYSYHTINQQMLSVAEQSERTLHRARRVIIHLISGHRSY